MCFTECQWLAGKKEHVVPSALYLVLLWRLMPSIYRSSSRIQRSWSMNSCTSIQVGMTPLMLACRLGHESMVDMLVSVFGAEIDPADKVRGWRKRPQKQHQTFEVPHYRIGSSNRWNPTPTFTAQPLSLWYLAVNLRNILHLVFYFLAKFENYARKATPRTPSRPHSVIRSIV